MLLQQIKKITVTKFFIIPRKELKEMLANLLVLFKS